jgi:hypothetical protein
MPGNTPTGLVPAAVSAGQPVSDAFTIPGLIPGHVDVRNCPCAGFSDTAGRS